MKVSVGDVGDWEGGVVVRSRAALASSMFRSCSSAYWAEKEPALPRVVARLEMRICGGGVRDERVEGQVVRSVEMWVVSLDGLGEVLVEGGRREMVETWETEGEERRVVRIWEPCRLSVMVEVVGSGICRSDRHSRLRGSVTLHKDLPPSPWNPGVRRSSLEIL